VGDFVSYTNDQLNDIFESIGAASPDIATIVAGEDVAKLAAFGAAAASDVDELTVADGSAARRPLVSVRGGPSKLGRARRAQLRCADVTARPVEPVKTATTTNETPRQYRRGQHGQALHLARHRR
jgi:hypothetical protein